MLVAPTPTAPIAAPPPNTARGDISADEMELQRTLRGGIIEGRTTVDDAIAGLMQRPFKAED